MLMNLFQDGNKIKLTGPKFQTLSTTRLLEDTVRKADDPLQSFASILINIAPGFLPALSWPRGLIPIGNIAELTTIVPSVKS